MYLRLLDLLNARKQIKYIQSNLALRNEIGISEQFCDDLKDIKWQ